MGPFRCPMQVTVSIRCEIGEEKWEFGNYKRLWYQPFHFKMVTTDWLPGITAIPHVNIYNNIIIIQITIL